MTVRQGTPQSSSAASLPLIFSWHHEMLLPFIPHCPHCPPLLFRCVIASCRASGPASRRPSRTRSRVWGRPRRRCVLVWGWRVRCVLLGGASRVSRDSYLTRTGLTPPSPQTCDHSARTFSLDAASLTLASPTYFDAGDHPAVQEGVGHQDAAAPPGGRQE